MEASYWFKEQNKLPDQQQHGTPSSYTQSTPLTNQQPQSNSHHLSSHQFQQQPPLGGGTPGIKKNGFTKPPIAQHILATSYSQTHTTLFNRTGPVAGYQQKISNNGNSQHSTQVIHPPQLDDESQENLDTKLEEDNGGVRVSNGREEKKRRNIFGEHSVDKMKNKSPYSVSVKALPRFKNVGGGGQASSAAAHSDSKNRKIKTFEGSSELSQGGQMSRSGKFNSQGTESQKQIQVLTRTGLHDAHDQPHNLNSNAFMQKNSKHSSTNVNFGFTNQSTGGSEMKPHLPPLDPKTPNDTTVKKPLIIQKGGIISASEMNFCGTNSSLVDHSGGAISTHNAGSSIMNGGGGPNFHHRDENQLDDRMTSEGAAVVGSGKFDTKQAARAPLHHQYTRGGHQNLNDQHAKVAKTEMKMKYTLQSPENNQNQAQSLKKLPQQQSRIQKKPFSNQQLQIPEFLNSKKKNPTATTHTLNPQQLHETSPISRNLQFDNVSQSQTLHALNEQHSRVSPQIRPPESHAYTRVYKLRYQNGENFGTLNQQQVLRESRSKPNIPFMNTAAQLQPMKQESFPPQTRAGFRIHNFNEPQSQLDNNYSNLGFGSGIEKVDSANNRASILTGYGPNGPAAGRATMKEELVMFSDSGIGERFGPIGADGLNGVEPESFSDQFSSNMNDRNTFQEDMEEESLKIGRGGLGDSEEDVRLYKDIEIRLKIEQLTLPLLQGIYDRIRRHLHGQGKPAFANLIGLLYHQFAKLTQRLSVSPPSNPGEHQSKTHLHIIKQLQQKNIDLGNQVQSLQNEVYALRLSNNMLDERPEDKIKELFSKNQDLIVEVEMLRERLAEYESSSERDLPLENAEFNYHHQKEAANQDSISPANLIVLNEQKGQIFNEASSQQESGIKAPSIVPKLNLEKALQINMRMYNSQQQQQPLIQEQMTQFQAPMESSNRGKFMGYKLSNNFSNLIQNGGETDEQIAANGLPLPPVVINHQPLVRPTTTMGGGRKKMLVHKPANEDNCIQEIKELNSTHREEDSHNADVEISDQKASGKTPTATAVEVIDSFDRIKQTKPYGKLNPISKKPPQQIKQFEEKLEYTQKHQEPKDEQVNAFGKQVTMKKLPIKMKGFHDEFMDKYDEFSLSWRAAIDREKRF